MNAQPRGGMLPRGAGAIVAAVFLLDLLAVLLPIWLVRREELRVEIWLYAGATLGPLTAAVLLVFLYSRFRLEADSADPEGYYAALEIDVRQLRRLSEQQVQGLITRQYHALSRQHHPDVASDPSRMPLINRAYAELKDPERRRRYGRRE